VSSLREIVSADDAKNIAQVILSLSYGFWLQFAHHPATFDAARAHNMALEVIEARIQMSWNQRLQLTSRSMFQAPAPAH
jgi:hypothetical protein